MLYNLRHFQFIYSKKRLGLQCRVTFNQGTRRRFGTWRLGGGGGSGWLGFGNLCVPLEKSWQRFGTVTVLTFAFDSFTPYNE